MDASLNRKPLNDFLSSLSESQSVAVYYNEEETSSLSINGVDEYTNFMRWAQEFLYPFAMHVIKIDRETLVIVSDKIHSEFGNRNENYKLFKGPNTKKAYEIAGVVKTNDEPLPGVQIILPTQEIGTVSDANGRYTLKVPVGVNKIEFKYLGYEYTAYVLCVQGSGSLDVHLMEEYQELDELVIVAQAEDHGLTNEVAGVESMSIETIKSIPTFMGEIDPIKSISSLPGVSSGELSSGFNVRGGDTGQNLILQDEAIIFNPSHLFGFFSAFNPDMVSAIQLFKGGGPAAYGGRVSSTLDIGLRKGNTSRFSLKGGIGLVSGRVTAEIPVIKDKASLLIGGRIAYPDWLIRKSKDVELKNNSADFYDLTFKYHHYINNKNIVTLSGYHSHDDFLFAADTTSSAWGTLNFAASWINNISHTSTLKVSVSNSNYQSQLEDQDGFGSLKASNGYRNFRLKSVVKSDWSATLNTSVGLESNYYVINPGEETSFNEGVQSVTRIDHHVGLENAAFGSAEMDLSELAFMVGVRVSTFHRLGPGTIYTYDYENTSGRLPVPSGSEEYGPGQRITSYLTLEPRVSFRWLATPSLSVKTSYYRTSQYLHLISNTSTSVPQDYWIASGPYIKPQVGDQFSVGLFKNLPGKKWEVSIEPFYKMITKALDYTDGLDITQNPFLEGGLVQGEGRVHGVEFLLNKGAGRLNGWLSYTYSRSLRKFRGGGILADINEGAYYPSGFDKPHSLSLVSTYHISDRTTFSVNFTYATGQPITLPIANYTTAGIPAVLVYSKRNEYRVPDYHRLDMSLTIRDKSIRNKSFNGEWNFSLFNVYARKNAYSVYFDEYGRAIKLYVLGSIFPSVSYNFGF